MPNYVTNRVHLTGEQSQIKAVLDFIKSDEMCIDFNKIIPMPKELDVEAGSLGEMAHSILFNSDMCKYLSGTELSNRFSKLNIEDQKRAVLTAIQYEYNIKNFGYPTWYDWSIDNWNTKWNACEDDTHDCTDDTIFFLTAWSAPFKVIEKLSSMYPTITFELTWADEDCGNNVGKLTYLNNVIIDDFVPVQQSIEAFELFFELRPDFRECFKLVNGEYVNNEDDEIV